MSQNTRWVAAIKAEALREAADATYSHTTIDQKNRRHIEKRPVLSADTRQWLRDRADALVMEGDK